MNEVFMATMGAMILFCLILVAGNVLRELASRLADGRISIVTFFQLLGLLFPFVFSFSLPLGFLSGVLIGLGRLSSSREITAMKATGSSIWGIAVPVFVLAVLGSGIACVTNNWIAPLSRTTYKTMMVEALRDDPLRFFQTGVLSREFPGYVLFIQDKKGDELEGFWLWELDDDKRPSLFIRAEQGQVEFDKDRDTLILTLKKGLAERWPKNGSENNPLDAATIYFEEFPVELPLSYSLGAAEVDREISEYALPELLAFLREEAPIPEQHQKEPELLKRQIRVQISNNFSLAASLMALSVVGVPLAIRTGRKETYANAMLALGLGLVYYFLVSMVASLDLPAKYHPEYLVWVPNLVMFVIGGVLMIRVHRH